MQPIRTILWLSRGEEIPVDLAGEAPTLDFVWERSVEGALALEPQHFDALVIDAASAGEALAALRGLRVAPRLPPLLVRLARARGGRAGAAARGRRRGRAAARARGRARRGRAARERREARARACAARCDAALPSPARAPAQDGIVGESPVMQQLFGLIACASRARATVLISGETGTGKELIARAIHRGSPRAARPFVAVNCAAFPDTLLESELFGCVKGAFTGADRDRAGLFEAADGGTLFLDEVGETSGPFQAKLLRVLQERELRPVGGTRSRRVDVRVVAASNRDLWRQSQAGASERTSTTGSPSSRSRCPRCASAAATSCRSPRASSRCTATPRAPCPLAPDAARLLEAHAWPGNVRELENEIQRALALAHPARRSKPAISRRACASRSRPSRASSRRASRCARTSSASRPG